MDVMTKIAGIATLTAGLAAFASAIWIWLTYIFYRESKRPIFQLQYDFMPKKRYYKEYEENNHYEENDKDQFGTVFIIINVGESPAMNVSIAYADGVTICTPLLNTNENIHKFIVNSGAFILVEYHSLYRKRKYTQILDFVSRNPNILYSEYRKEEKKRGINI